MDAGTGEAKYILPQNGVGRNSSQEHWYILITLLKIN